MPVLNFIATSCLYELLGVTTSYTTTLVLPVAGVLTARFVGTFNCLGKFTLYRRNVADDNISNATEIAELML